MLAQTGLAGGGGSGASPGGTMTHPDPGVVGGPALIPVSAHTPTLPASDSPAVAGAGAGTTPTPIRTSPRRSGGGARAVAVGAGEGTGGGAGTTTVPGAAPAAVGAASGGAAALQANSGRLAYPPAYPDLPAAPPHLLHSAAGFIGGGGDTAGGGGGSSGALAGAGGLGVGFGPGQRQQPLMASLLAPSALGPPVSPVTTAEGAAWGPTTFVQPSPDAPPSGGAGAGRGGRGGRGGAARGGRGRGGGGTAGWFFSNGRAPLQKFRPASSPTTACAIAPVR